MRAFCNNIVCNSNLFKVNLNDDPSKKDGQTYSTAWSGRNCASRSWGRYSFLSHTASSNNILPISDAFSINGCSSKQFERNSWYIYV